MIHNNQIVRVKKYNNDNRPNHVVKEMRTYEGTIVTVLRYDLNRLTIDGDRYGFVWLDKDFVKVNNEC